MNKYLTLAVTLLAAGTLSLSAQNRKALKINEVMVQNESSIVDDYGQRGAWIELFNSNFGPLEISSVYLTNDSLNKTKYPVPLGDARTKMGKRQRLVFFADQDPDKGTFHTSFTLVPGKDNWIGLYDADGLTLIDEVTIPATLPAGASYARTSDGADAWEVRDGLTAGKAITPGGANVTEDGNPKIQRFANEDAHGFSMTVMAMCIVFSALLLLCLSFYFIGAIGKRISRLNKARATGVDLAQVPRDNHDSGEEIAAITMALHEHLNQHDQESTILTIKKMRRAYSPWSSKIYSLREIPQRRK